MNYSLLFVLGSVNYTVWIISVSEYPSKNVKLATKGLNRQGC
jgi:hypothetical protein